MNASTPTVNAVQAVTMRSCLPITLGTWHCRKAFIPRFSAWKSASEMEFTMPQRHISKPTQGLICQEYYTRKKSAKCKRQKNTLLKSKKPLEAGRIIPELTFGFWTSLFDVRYEKILWPWLLKPVVPNMPRHIRIRKNLSKRLNRVRTLRNRIFHHEPIWHWRDLQNQHTEILEAITWVNPAMKAFVEPFDRFEKIYKNGIGEYRKIITALS